MRVVLVFLALVAGLAAQARVSGVVKDVSGAVVPRTRVRLDSVERVTGDDGRFVFDAVVSGEYTLRAESPGFRILTRRIAVSGPDDLDLGEIELVVGQFACPAVEIVEAVDCWHADGATDLTSTRLTKLAISTPLPSIPSPPIEGVVRVKILAAPSGEVTCAAAIRGDSRLGREALMAVGKWRFRPGRKFVGYLDFRFSKHSVSVK